MIGIVVVLTLLLAVDIGAQFVIAGHTASPVIDGGILAILGGCVAASRGPQPNSGDPPAVAPLEPLQSPGPPTLPAPTEPAQSTVPVDGGDGRHRAPGGNP